MTVSGARHWAQLPSHSVSSDMTTVEKRARRQLRDRMLADAEVLEAGDPAFPEAGPSGLGGSWEDIGDDPDDSDDDDHVQDILAGRAKLSMSAETDNLAHLINRLSVNISKTAQGPRGKKDTRKRKDRNEMLSLAFAGQSPELTTAYGHYQATRGPEGYENLLVDPPPGAEERNRMPVKIVDLFSEFCNSSSIHRLTFERYLQCRGPSILNGSVHRLRFRPQRPTSVRALPPFHGRYYPHSRVLPLCAHASASLHHAGLCRHSLRLSRISVEAILRSAAHRLLRSPQPPD